jgi:Tfp pilus assembly protein PilV
VLRRAREEDGFGLIELAIAMVVLNVGIFALIAAFQSGTLAVSRSAKTSSATVVADKTMEVFRALQNRAIYLDAPASGGNDVSGYPNGIPNSTSSWYTKYIADSAAYGGTPYSYTGNGSSTPLWVTQWTDSTRVTSYPPIVATDTTKVPSGLSPDPRKAVQLVTGPDGQSYPVFIYVIMVQPNGSSGWVKQVTVDVCDPKSTSKIIVRESSLFDPNVAP